MPRRNLLICFDAFGTLFKPKRSIEEQYTSVAHKFGVGINPDGTSQFNSADVRASFRSAFKNSAKEYPNYGRAVGMGATAWWTKVINDTFTPLLPQSQRTRPLPAGLAAALIHRFASAEGYVEPSPSLRTLFHRLRSISSTEANPSNATQFDRMIVGVITNSDDRVPDILSSFGLRIGPLRFGQPAAASASPGTTPSRAENTPGGGAVNDVDFTCISYDVGHEKPDVRIFKAAEDLAKTVKFSEKSTPSPRDTNSWVKVFVGDEYKHDVEGALKAGWIPVWIPEMDGRAGTGNIVARPDGHYDVVAGNDLDVVSLDDTLIGRVTLEDVFGDMEGSHHGPADQGPKRLVRCASLEVLISWLAER